MAKTQIVNITAPKSTGDTPSNPLATPRTSVAAKSVSGDVSKNIPGDASAENTDTYNPSFATTVLSTLNPLSDAQIAANAVASIFLTEEERINKVKKSINWLSWSQGVTMLPVGMAEAPTAALGVWVAQVVFIVLAMILLVNGFGFASAPSFLAVFLLNIALVKLWGEPRMFKQARGIIVGK